MRQRLRAAVSREESVTHKSKSDLLLSTIINLKYLPPKPPNAELVEVAAPPPKIEDWPPPPKTEVVEAVDFTVSCDEVSPKGDLEAVVEVVPPNTDAVVTVLAVVLDLIKK